MNYLSSVNKQEQAEPKIHGLKVIIIVIINFIKFKLKVIIKAFMELVHLNLQLVKLDLTYFIGLFI